jgi:tRNA threonylcarbamoyladenosine biosynthesis protein TsaE
MKPNPESPSEKCVHTESPEETVALGRTLGALLGRGDVIALGGPLGSGKTYFTKGLALGMDVIPETVVTSPSFSLVNEYEGRCALFHIDAYRLENVADFLSVGLDEYFYEDGVAVVEWADRWPHILPARTLFVHFDILGDTSRKITFSALHPRGAELLSHHM